MTGSADAREGIIEELTQYLEAAGMTGAQATLEAMGENELWQLREHLPLPGDTVGQGIDMSDGMKALLENEGGMAIDKAYEDARWILRTAVAIANEVDDIDAICLSDGGELMFIVSGDAGFLHCCTNVQMVEEYWQDPDPGIREIIESLTKWKYYDEGEEMEEYEPDDSLSDEENEAAEEQWYEGQAGKADEEHDRFMRAFAERFNAALEERFGSKAPQMIEYLRLWT